MRLMTQKRPVAGSVGDRVEKDSDLDPLDPEIPQFSDDQLGFSISHQETHYIQEDPQCYWNGDSGSATPG